MDVPESINILKSFKTAVSRKDPHNQIITHCTELISQLKKSKIEEETLNIFLNLIFMNYNYFKNEFKTFKYGWFSECWFYKIIEILFSIIIHFKIHVNTSIDIDDELPDNLANQDSKFRIAYKYFPKHTIIEYFITRLKHETYIMGSNTCLDELSNSDHDIINDNEIIDNLIHHDTEGYGRYYLKLVEKGLITPSLGHLHLACYHKNTAIVEYLILHKFIPDHNCFDLVISNILQNTYRKTILNMICPFIVLTKKDLLALIKNKIDVSNCKVDDLIDEDIYNECIINSFFPSFINQYKPSPETVFSQAYSTIKDLTNSLDNTFKISGFSFRDSISKKKLKELLINEIDKKITDLLVI